MKLYFIQDYWKDRTRIVKVLSYLGLVYAVLGWFNEVLLHWTKSILLSHYSEYIAIGIFGIYRVAVEKNLYTKKRIAVLTAMVLGFWALLPYLFTLREPALGYFSDKAIWGPSLHIPMTLTFFLSLVLVALFGRRAVCSWNCPCVGTRDTIGAAFRKETIKSKSHDRCLFRFCGCRLFRFLPCYSDYGEPQLVPVDLSLRPNLRYPK